jgi:hypothetical protein
MKTIGERSGMGYSCLRLGQEKIGQGADMTAGKTLRKPLFAALIFFAILPALYGQSPADPQFLLDGAVKSLGADINTRFAAEKVQKAVLLQWTFEDAIPPLGAYWKAQLMEELTNIPGRSYSVGLDNQAGADWRISGTIIEAGRIIRVYTQLIQASDNSVKQILHSDFTRSEYLIDMLSYSGRSGGSSSTARDVYEPDSRENPYSAAIAGGEDGPVVNRSLHNSGDEDFFLLIPAADGTLVVETTGGTDTYLEFYEAGSTNQIDSNDDGGSGSNARIRRSVQAGGRYIAKVRGYSGDTGSYGFRAYLVEQVRLTPDQYEDDNEFNDAKDISIGSPQQHTFHNGGDVDWVKFQVTRPGRFIIQARGLNSARLDTYIELYDSNNNLIDDDDDGGEDMDSRLSVQLQTGTYYIKVKCLNSEPDQPYTISAAAGG